MKEKMIEYFNKEYEETVKLFANKPFWLNPKESVMNTAHRYLGVAMFIQTVDPSLSFEEVNIEYEKLRKKLENLL